VQLIASLEQKFLWSISRAVRIKILGGATRLLICDALCLSVCLLLMMLPINGFFLSRRTSLRKRSSRKGSSIRTILAWWSRYRSWGRPCQHTPCMQLFFVLLVPRRIDRVPFFWRHHYVFITPSPVISFSLFTTGYLCQCSHLRWYSSVHFHWIHHPHAR
jgi:hypothetical protein